MRYRPEPTRQSTLKKFIRHAMWVPAAATALSLPAVTQADTQATVDEIMVTGSRIVRRDANSVGPITTITPDEIAAAAPLSIGQLLQTLPAAGVSLNSNGTQGTSFGVSSINLRYLGTVEGSGNRTLVLVDGRRWVNAVGGRGFRDFVDLNTIPMGIIESVEVLKDGASAIYGADAIAGVVNIRTRRDFEGLEMTLQGGETSRSDGRNLSAQGVYGRKLDNGSLLLSANFVEVDPILTTDRRLTRRTLVPTTAPPTSPRGLYALPGISTAAQPLTRIPGASGSSPDDFRTASLPDDDFNTLAQGNYLQGDSKRVGVFGRITTDLTRNVTFTNEALFNHRTSSQLFAPLPLSVAGGNGYTIPADHPFNPFDLDFSGTGFRIQRVPVEVGDRRNSQDVKTLRFVSALEGTGGLFQRDWLWDSFVAFSQNEARFNIVNQINFDNVALGIGPNDRCAANGCVPINLFGELTPEMADYIRQNGQDQHRNTQLTFGANATTTLTELPAGPLGMATGVEFRRESALDRPDGEINEPPEFVTGINRTSGAPRDGTSGSYNVKEAYVEFNVPLAADAPLAQSLDLSAALRYSDYSTFGSTTTGKLGLAWRPLDDVLLRATWSEGFRAPSILELYQGGRETSFPAIDPCNNGGGALPGCAGVPASYNQSQFRSGLISGLTGGNPDLKPETSETLSAGLVFTPRWVDDLTLSVDWFRIDIKDAIAARNAQQILNACANVGGANCNLVVRDPNTGEVLRLLQAVSNFTQVEVEGIDFTLRYGFDVGQSRITTVLDASRLIHFTNKVPQPDGTIVVQERAGKGDSPRSTLPHWKGTGSLRWSRGDWEAGWRGRYIGSSDDVPDNFVNGGRHSSILYHDLQLVYHLRARDMSLTLGVDNVTDKAPPASRANAPINFDIYTYDARGSFIYLRLFAAF